MRVLAIVYEAHAGPGVFAAPIAAAGHQLEEWTPAASPAPAADPLGYDAVLVLGGAMNVDQRDRHPWLAEQERLLAALIERGTPLLGLCLGSQLLAAAAGASVGPAPRPEIGWHRVELSEEGGRDPLLAPLAPGFEAFQWHSYAFELPPGAVPLASSAVGLQGARIGERAWALQFHPEVSPGDAASWIADYRADENAVRIGIDPVALAAETKQKIGAFNQLGRELCARWLATAAG